MVDKIEIKSLIHRNKKYIELNGEKYFLDERETKDGKSRDMEKATLTFRKFDEKEYDKMIEEIAEVVSKKLNGKELLKQALHDSSLEEIIAMKKEIEKPMPRIRNFKGCVQIGIGKQRLHLRD